MKTGSLRLLIWIALKAYHSKPRTREIAAKYGIDTGFRSLYVNHNHLFYYKEDDIIIVAEMFGEKEDFMCKLFGISG